MIVRIITDDHPATVRTFPVGMEAAGGQWTPDTAIPPNSEHDVTLDASQHLTVIIKPVPETGVAQG